MTTERLQSSREKAIRKYFDDDSGDLPYALPIALFLIGGSLIVVGFAQGPLLLFLLIGIVFIILAIFAGNKTKIYFERKQKKNATDRQIDRWLQESLVKLGEQSLGKLNLDKSDIVADPLVIKGPIVWQTNGIDDSDLLWKIGDDNIVRFGVYRVTIVQLTDRHLGAYACDYNFIRNVALNERTDEYHYKDVVSVSTQEQASSYTLPTGVKLTTAQEFRISVASGESINVTIGSSQINKITGSDQIPETGAEKAISVIRAMLREKKG